MPSPVSSGYELSPQQKLFYAQGKESSTAGIAILVEGSKDAAKVRAVVAQIVQRHEILRTSFERRTGMKFPFQVVHEKAAFGWEEVDLSGFSTDQQHDRVAEFLKAAPLDLEKAVVLHARLANLGSNRHALALTFSALCVDDASLNQIFAEITLLLAGQPLPDDPLQYADYSEWQSECLNSKEEDAKFAAEAWAKTEFTSLPALSVPFERKQSSGASSWKTVQVALSGASSSTQDTLLAAWLAFLQRTTGRTEFCVGYESSGRNHEEFASGIGLYARTLPMRTELDPDSRLRDLQLHVAAALSSALDRQDYFAADRVESHLSIGFAFHEEPTRKSASGLTVSEIARNVTAPAFRLQLRCAASGGKAQAFLDYDAAFISSETAGQLAERFAIFVNAAQPQPDSSVSALPIMSAAERQKVVVEFNQTTAACPKEKCIHQLFEEQAKQHPDRPALRFGETALTYAELKRESNRIANVLVQSGVKANVPVALCTERSGEMIIALLGILKAGGCYVPLVPDNPKPRLAHQLSETGAPVILTHAKHLSNLPEFGGKIICLDRDRALLAAASGEDPATKVSPQDLVYVIYTSGSTGTPKGVAVRHFNLVNYSHFICNRLKLNEHPEGLNFATVSTISADLGNTCIFPSLISGGCLHVIGYETAMSSSLFADYGSRHAIDVLKITPSHLSSLVNGERGDDVLPRKYLILGGEAGRWDLVERIRKAKKCALLNHYGPTEATVGCCTFAAETDVSAWEPATLPIGKPIANDAVYILDGKLQPVPVGVAGELCIGGTGLAQGYLNQPQQTSERFVRNPFSSDADARIYRTGDLARFLPDGNIEFLGRIDAQVKIRGFRVEPAEIEAVLKKHPSVSQTAVVPYEGETGEKKLAAYVVTASPAKVEELRAFLAQQIPDYMVPSAFVIVDSLPLTANGKLDLPALPAPDQQPAAREYVAPRTPDEERLAQIWQEVLRLDRVGVTDNFFELGGHSLLATQIISRIRNMLRLQMPLAGFLQNPTIAALAEQLIHCPAVESEQEEMERLLQELEGISDEEAERLLAAEKNNGGGR